MRKLLAVLNYVDLRNLVSHRGNMLGKYSDNGPVAKWLLLEQPRGSFFDGLSQRKKLLHAGAAFGPRRSRKLIHGGIANLAHDNLVGVQHRKPERKPFLVMSLDLVTDQ